MQENEITEYDNFFSVYIHIPFCSRRCDYCDFATWTDKEDQIDLYIETVLKQWQYHLAHQSDMTNKSLRSIFFGGGTPNLIDAKHISKIISTIKSSVGSIAYDVEITVESNPDHVNLEKMSEYVRGGVNRISLGVQSTNNEVLNYLGREHDPSQVRKAIEIIKQSGIKNFSCDLIYGSGNESLEVFENSLNEIIDMRPNHISSYSLGIEKGTALYDSVSSGVKKDVDEDDLADKYELADKLLSENGYSWYEISNWSKPGYESKHNLSYWRGVDVIALGCASHGYTNSQRVATPRDINRYIAKFSGDISNSKFDELFTLIKENDNIDSKMENFALKLRTKQGIFWPSADLIASVVSLINEGFCEYDSESSIISLTLKGRLLAHSITLSLYESYQL